MYIHMCACVCTLIYIFVYRGISLYVWEYVYLMYICVCLYLCRYVCIQLPNTAWLYWYVFIVDWVASVYVHMWMCVCVHVSIYNYKNTVWLYHYLSTIFIYLTGPPLVRQGLQLLFGRRQELHLMIGPIEIRPIVVWREHERQGRQTPHRRDKNETVSRARKPVYAHINTHMRRHIHMNR